MDLKFFNLEFDIPINVSLPLLMMKRATAYDEVCIWREKKSETTTTIQHFERSGIYTMMMTELNE